MLFAAVGTIWLRQRAFESRFQECSPRASGEEGGLIMRYRPFEPSYYVAIALSLSPAAPTFAQAPASPQSAASQSAELSEIIVTARRVEERLQDVPISITVLSQDTIAKRNIYNAGDLGAYVPSLSSNANFGPQKSSFA